MFNMTKMLTQTKYDLTAALLLFLIVAMKIQFIYCGKVYFLF